MQLRSKARRETQSFVIEGIRLAEEALAAGIVAQLVLFTGELDKRGEHLLEGFIALGCLVEEVSPRVMRSVCDTQNPQEILAVLPMHTLTLPPKPDLILIPDQLRDPGNLGSILRTAVAAAVDAVLVPPGNADIYAPKVLRSAMGAHFHLPIHHFAWQKISDFIRRTSLRVYLADVGAKQLYTSTDFCVPLALILGGEAQGAGRTAYDLAETRVRIPMPGDMESLNVAAAAAILIFEILRQRNELSTHHSIH